FPEPRPSIEAYEGLVNDYREKHQIASNGGSRMEREAKDNAKAAVAQAMKELAFYVNTIANGNREVLASSGFELVSQRQASTIPGIPANVRLLDGRISGEMRLMFFSMRSAWAYEDRDVTAVDVGRMLVWDQIYG